MDLPGLAARFIRYMVAALARTTKEYHGAWSFRVTATTAEAGLVARAGHSGGAAMTAAGALKGLRLTRADQPLQPN